MDLARNELDAKILRLADHCSPSEISRELGGALSPARVAAHTKALLKSQDWLTEAEQDAIVTWKMRRILGDLEGRFLDMENAKVQLQLLKAIGDRLDKRRAATDDEKNALYGNQAQLMYEAVQLAVGKAVLAIQHAHPDVDEDVARQALKEALPEAVYIISSRNAGHEIEA